MEPNPEVVKVSAGCYGAPVKRKATIRRIWRIVWVCALIVVAAPFALVPVYRFAPPVSTPMVLAGLTGQAIERTWVSLDDIAPSLVAAVIMSEDGKFCGHHGVDWAEINKVIAESDPRPRGASTVAMQTVRNLFLWRSRSYVRKGLEIPLALYGDLVWGKRRELEIYLNIVEWGPGIFGVEAAARHYFGVAAKSLNPRQSALLAVTLPNPAARDPAHPSRLMESLAGTVAARARAAGAYVDCLYR
jgi:monofunctional biosynthetic peptidoglycan transglycosylase